MRVRAWARAVVLALFVLVPGRGWAQGGTIGGGTTNVKVTDSVRAVTFDSLKATNIWAGNGTAAAPSISLLNSRGTGLYRFGADTLGFATGGTARMRLQSTGLTPVTDLTGTLGTSAHRWNGAYIGLTTLTQTQVSGASASCGSSPPYAFDGDLNTGVCQVGVDTAGIVTNGALSLGIRGGASATLFGGAGNMTIQAGTGNSRTMTLQTTTSAGTAKNTLVLGADSSATFLGAGTFNNGLTVNNATTAVQALTATTGTFGTNAASAGIVKIPNNNAIQARNAANSADINIVYINASNAMVFGPSDVATLSTTMLTLSGVGITATTGTFTGKIVATGDTLRTTSKIRATALTAASGTPNAVCMDATTKEIVENAATSCVVSSARYKKDIRPLPYAQAKRIVTSVQPVAFTYRDGGREAIGGIAEQVDSVDRRLVSYDTAGRPNAINYEQVTTALLAVVQRQQKRLDAMCKSGIKAACE